MKCGQRSLRLLSFCLMVMLRLMIAPVSTMALPLAEALEFKNTAKTLHADETQLPKPVTHGQRIDAKLDKRALIHALQKGGYVLYFRHAITDRSQIDADRINLHNCATQRNLTEAGRKQAQVIGKAMQALGIAVAEVLTSPYCRCIETAKLAFGKFTVSADLVWTLGQPEAETRRLAEALRQFLKTRPPKGENTVLVSHTANLKEAIGVWPEPEGAVYVFQPREDGAVSHLGNIAPEEWTALIQREE